MSSLKSIEPGSVVEDPPTYLDVTMQDSLSVCSFEVVPHFVPDVSIDNTMRAGPSHRERKHTPKPYLASSMCEEVDSMGSDTLSVNTNKTPKRKPSESDEKRSLLEVGRRHSSRRGSATPSYPSSPRPGSRGSRRSRRGSRRRRSSKEPSTRGELLMELGRDDSVQSRDSHGRFARDSKRDKSQSRQRKDSSSSSSSSSSASSESQASAAGVGGDISRKRRRGYMTAQEAAELGDVLCGCVLKDKFFYFVRPLIFVTIGTILMAGGVVLTALHFIYEDSLTPPKNPPYFTWGPITLSTGVILFMVGLVWIPIKEQKWKEGKASPMLAALEKWRAENLDREELQMTDLGEVKAVISEEIKIDETALVTGKNKMDDAGETSKTEEKMEKNVNT